MSSTSSPNWGYLYEQGRCRAIGVPWSEEELNAIYELHIPAEYVRMGCLRMEDYEKKKNKIEEESKELGHTPIRYMKKVELQEYAKKLNINFTDEAGRQELIQLINDTESKLPTSEAGSLES